MASGGRVFTRTFGNNHGDARGEPARYFFNLTALAQHTKLPENEIEIKLQQFGAA